MKYPDGQEVLLGDRVQLGEDDAGIVVCNIDGKEYTEENPKAQWDYLKKGVMINFPKFGLIHYEEPEEDLELICRSKSET
jgi:hypothetical protein